MRIKILSLFLCILLSVGITGGKLHSSVLENKIENLNKVEIVDETEEFLYHIGFRESTNSYSVVNKHGYLGKYQFSMRTIQYLGYNVTAKEFLNSPELQEEVMLSYLHHNRSILQNCIEKYDSIYRHGIFVTESGILAAAHLGGATGVKRFLTKGQDFSDKFGTKVSNYLEEFSGYSLNF